MFQASSLAPVLGTRPRRDLRMTLKLCCLAPLTNMRHRSPRVPTRPHRVPALREVTNRRSVATDARAAPRAVTPDNNGNYRTAGAESAGCARSGRSSRVADSKKFLRSRAPDSPRHQRRGRPQEWQRSVGAGDNDKTERDGSTCPRHWPGNDDWPVADATAAPPGDTPHCNSD